ncbi:reverse transcriptase [Colletotrichum tofieldiae]|nr:reverse transcriptase [Colletotrichum tofieldiae]GKT68915.1 reverse transcriptase [Colletotrichum tofieldiae]
MLQKALELLDESLKESQWLKEALKQQLEVMQRQEGRIQKQEEMIRDLNSKLDDTTEQMNEELK